MDALNTWNLNDELNIISDPSGTLYPAVIVQNAPNLCLSDVDLWFSMLPTNSADLVVMNLKDCTGWGGGN